MSYKKNNKYDSKVIPVFCFACVKMSEPDIALIRE